ncbi:MAG: protein kinase [Anaerolineae bacterium]|nr:protein kinase [Anaerolineae bacterium]
MIETQIHPLEQYDLGHPITRDGHLLTCLSRHRLSDAYVEINILDSSLADDGEAVERFAQIIQRARTLQNPSILSVIEQGIYQGKLYYATSCISGGTLGQFLKLSGPLPIAQVVRWITQLGDAVDYAHTQGIVFPGFTPYDILRVDDQQVLLADFGLCEWWYELDGLKARAMPYAAPELLLRMPYTPSIDVYALGILLYQMLTGQLPFEGATPTQWLHAHWRQSLPPAQAIRADLSAETQEVLKTATAKLGANRYSTAREMVECLCASLNVDVPGQEDNGKSVPVRKLVAYRYHKTKPLASHTGKLSMGRMYAEALVQEQADPVQAIALYREIAATWPQFAQSDVVDRLERLERKHGANHLPRLVSEARQALSLGDWYQLETLALEILSYAPDYSEAEQMQSLARSRSAADEHYRSAHRATETACHATAVMLLRELYAAMPHHKDQASLLVITPSNAGFLRERASLQAHQAQILALGCSPNGGTVASGATDKAIGMWQAPGLSQHYVVPGLQSWVCSLAFSPDGSRVLAGLWDGDVRILDALGGGYVGTIAGHTSQVRAMAFARHDPDLLATVSGSFLTLWHMPGGVREAVIKEVGHGVWSLVFSPTTPQLICGLTNGMLRIRDTSALGCPVVKDIPVYTEPIYAVDCSPDGVWVASASRDGRAKLTEASSGETLCDLHGHQDSILDVRFSVNGDLVATAGMDRTIRIWGIQTGELLTTLHGHQAPITHVSFSPDGRWIASADIDGVIKTWSII